MKKIKQLIWLFGINLFISTFTFGGGYIVIPMIRKFFVQQRKIIQEQELMELAAVAQTSPGAIAVNLSVLAGYKTAGLSGAVVSCFSSILPPLFLVSLLTMGYHSFQSIPWVQAVLKGMEAGVAALIVDLVMGMCAAVFKERKPLSFWMIPLVFILNYFFQINIVFLIIGCLFVCFLEKEWIRRKKK